MNTMQHHAPQELMRTAQGFIQRQDFKNALSVCYQCIGQFPDFVPAYLYLSHYFLSQQQTPIAMQVLSKALEQVPGNPDACQMLAPLLASLVPREYHPTLEKDLQHCFEESQINHQLLARPAAQLLLHKYSLLSVSNPINWALLTRRLTEDKLCEYFLSQSINTYPLMETRLTELRAFILRECSKEVRLPEPLINLVSAFAIQVFASEYVLAVSDEEILICKQLQNLLTNTNDEDKQISASLLLTLYQPLFSIENLPYTLLQQKAQDYPLLTQLLERSYQDIHVEKELTSTIISMTSVTDEVSEKVRAQYEQHPYPRWQAPPAPKPARLAAVIQSLPGINPSQFNASNPLKVFIAGCGTGYEPIDLARMDNSLKIIAIDLSHTSLAYAQRMATKLGVAKNIDFRQGNILAADQLNTQFDVINSTGVLHHMENPEEGWLKLCAMLKTGGVMNISLYSARARSRIVAAHALIKEQDLTATNNSIRHFRQHILAMDHQSGLGELVQSDDFYTISGCRDLLFHAQEHRFTLPAIAKLLEKLNLRLASFDTAPETTRLFKQHFGENADLLNLHLWDQFEQRFPDTFASMYRFWCQKI